MQHARPYTYSTHTDTARTRYTGYNGQCDREGASESRTQVLEGTWHCPECTGLGVGERLTWPRLAGVITHNHSLLEGGQDNNKCR